MTETRLPATDADTPGLAPASLGRWRVGNATLECQTRRGGDGGHLIRREPDPGVLATITIRDGVLVDVAWAPKCTETVSWRAGQHAKMFALVGEHFGTSS